MAARAQRHSAKLETGARVTDVGCSHGASTILMGKAYPDPVGAARHVREMLNPDGTWMILEPFANDAFPNNLNPIGWMFYAASTMSCTPASRAQKAGLCLGAQAGEARMRDVVTQGGFTRFRRAAETPLNVVYEARP